MGPLGSPCSLTPVEPRTETMFGGAGTREVSRGVSTQPSVSARQSHLLQATTHLWHFQSLSGLIVESAQIVGLHKGKVEAQAPWSWPLSCP